MADALFKRTDDGYRVTFVDAETEFHIDRLRWERDDLHGQLSVACALAGARSVDGIVSVGTFNLSSTRARRDRAKEVAERVRGNGKIDFVALLEEVCQRVLKAERQGTPAINLPDVTIATTDAEFDVDGFRVPRHHPTVLFGDGDSLKSFLVLYVLGTLAHRGHRVALFDWELDASTHRQRLARIFGEADMPPVQYVRCHWSLDHEVDRLCKVVRDGSIEYAAFDSIAFACAGPPENAEQAMLYYRATRRLGIGSLHVAHVRSGEENDQRPFGSMFWHNGARSTWFAKRADEESTTIHVGLFHRKANLGTRQPAVGFRVEFVGDVTHISPTPVAAVADLAAGLPLWQRMKQAVATGPRTLVHLADELHAKVDTLDRTVRRHTGLFTRITGRDGITQIALVDGRRSS